MENYTIFCIDILLYITFFSLFLSKFEIIIVFKNIGYSQYLNKAIVLVNILNVAESLISIKH